jgi:nucleotide-binding universal stress UspA family protein
MNEITAFAPEEILCPIDFSELSGLALKYAAAGALVYGSRLTVLHAERFELPRYFTHSDTDRLTAELARAKGTIENELARHVERILGPESKKLGIDFAVKDVNPVEAILETADKKSAGLIVLGTHGLSGVKRLLMGSVTENLVRAATIPVFTVRQKEHDFIDVARADAVPRLRRILCPCEVNDLGRVTLGHAVSLAERFKARLTVLFADESPETANLSRVRETFCNWVSETVTTPCDLEPVVRRGDAADQIITRATENEDDLVVIGARHRIFHDATILGKTTDLVMRHASVPVLIIPAFPD